MPTASELPGYHLLKQLSKGDSASVFLAQPDAGELCVVKLYDAVSPSTRASLNVHQAFLAELTALNVVSHPNVVSLLGFGVIPDTGQDYLVLEYVSGKGFDEEAKAATGSDFYLMVAQICRALGCMHLKGIIHGDIKPSNIIVARRPLNGIESPALKIVDFSHASLTDSAVRSRLSGTPRYLAPEVIRGAPPSAASDLYALGIVLRDILTDTDAESSDRAGVALQHRIAVDDHLASSQLQGPIAKLVGKLSSPDPAARPSSGFEALRFLIREGLIPNPPPTSQLQALEAFSGLSFVGTQKEEVLRTLFHSPLPTGRRRLIVLHGARGHGKTRLLREVAVGARLRGSGPVLLSRFSSITPDLLSSMRSSGDGQKVVLCDDVPADGVKRIATALTKSETPVGATIVVALSTPLGHSGESAQLRPSLPSEGIALEAFQIDSWGTREVGEVFSEVFGAKADSSDIASTVAAYAGGNPFLVLSIARAAVSRGIIQVTPSGLELTGSVETMPTDASLRTFLDAYLGALAPADYSLLTTLCGCENAMTSGHVSSLLCSDTSDVDAALGRLRARGLVQDVGGSVPHFRVSGKLVANFVLGQLDDQRRRDLQTKLGDWFVAQGDDASISIAAIHYMKAGNSAAVLEYASKAGHAAARSHAYSRAIFFFSSTMDHLTVGDPRRVTLSVDLATCLLNSGQLTLAWRTLAQLPRILSSAPDHATISMLKAKCLFLRGNLTDAEKWAKRARRTARRIGALDVYIESLIQLGGIYARTQQEAKARHVHLRASAMARRRNDKDHVSKSLSGLAFISWQQGSYRRALRYVRRDVSIQSCASNTLQQPQLYANTGTLQLALGRYAEARQSFRRAAELFRTSGEAVFFEIAGHNLGEVDRAQGRWRSALKSFRHTIEAAEHLGAHRLAVIARSNAARVCAQTGYIAEALSTVKGILRDPSISASSEVMTSTLSTIPAVLLATGRHVGALRASHMARRRANEIGNHDLLLEVECFVALAALAIGDPQDALKALTRARAKTAARSSCNVGLFAELVNLQCLLATGALDAVRSAADQAIRKAERKRMVWHITLGYLLRAEYGIAANDVSFAESSALAAAGIARTSRDRAFFWQAHYWLGRAYEQKLQYERALKKYRVAALTLHEIALELVEDKYKQPFLAQAKVRDALERYERLTKEVGKQARYDMATVSRSERVSRRMLGALNVIGQKLTSILDLHDLLKELLDLSIENVRAERGIVFLGDEAGGEMRPALARGVDKESLDGIDSFSRSVIKQVAAGSTLLTIDVGQDPTLSAYKSVVLHEIKSILAVPMRTRGKTVGVLYLDTRKGKQLFTDREKAFVESFASQAAIAIENARAFGQMTSDNARLRREAEGRARFENLVGASAPMKKMTDAIASVLDSDCNVLILGESGTGKELVARAIHYNGPRRKKKFVAIDCGAVPENLLEAELFGYARGAFTGADRERIGLIEEARGGTLFLDEITNTSLGFQSRLLRVLQEKEVRRLGENSPRSVDVRVIAATNADIKAVIQAGRFRQDLYYRLNVVSIVIPPLRDRREDIPLLAEHFLRKHADAKVGPKRLGPGVVESLVRYDWPGNLRELSNVLERAQLLSNSQLITVDDLPEALRPSAPASAGGVAGSGSKCGEQLMIEEALRRFGGDKAKAARFIGWNRQKLYRRMREFGISTQYGQAA